MGQAKKERVHVEWTVRQDWCGEMELAQGYSGEDLTRLLAEEKAGWTDGRTIVLYRPGDQGGHEVIARIFEASLADDDREIVRLGG